MTEECPPFLKMLVEQPENGVGSPGARDLLKELGEG